MLRLSRPVVKGVNWVQVSPRILIAAAVLLASSAVTNADQHWRPTEAQQEIIDLRVADTLRLLGEIVQSTLDNYQCQAKTFRRLGLSPAGGEVSDLVRCADSEQYTIRVRRDATGQTGVMSCTLLETLNINCDAMSRTDYLHP